MRRFISPLLFLALFGFAYFIWPGRYERRTGDFGQMVRIDRVTGTVEARDASGVWRDTGRTEKVGLLPSRESRDLVREDLFDATDRATGKLDASRELNAATDSVVGAARQEIGKPR